MAIKIFVDQGHNPRNPNAGAEGNGLREQDITYRVGVELARLLEADPNFEVRLSRPTPETVLGTTNAESLAARVNAANEWEADAFISIHVNSSNIVSATGSEAYVYNAESSAFQLGGDIIEGISYYTGFPARGVFIRPSLYVLRRTAMPATLIELGFISNPAEAAFMNSQPVLYARGIYYGIRQFYGVE